MSIPEKLMEDLIADYPREFIEDGLTLIERQSVYCGIGKNIKQNES